MGEGIPLVLVNCTLSFWEADAEGNPVGDPLWIGARTEGAQIAARFGEVNSTPSGASTEEYEQLGIEYLIRMGRIWVIDGKTRKTFKLERKKYVMGIYGEDERTGVYIRRTYFGVHAQSDDLDSVGIQYFKQEQSFRARSYIETDGSVPPGQASPKLTETGTGTQGATPITETPLNFFHAGPLMAGDYFLGLFAFPSARTVVRAKVIARMGQGEGTVIALETDGGISVVQLTIPAGGENVENGDSNTFSLVVPANKAMRWKVLSGPAEAVNAAWQACVSMNITDAPVGYVAAALPPVTGLEVELQVNDWTELRALPPPVVASFVRVVNPVGAQARELIWKPASLKSDNNISVGKPVLLSSGDAGRWEEW